MNFVFRKVIWAVGQGGFSSGFLYDANGQLGYSYVYDCGSNQLFELRQEIEVARGQGERVDTLFLSHLDSDHINGFETLCESFEGRVHEIVLPHLSPWDRLYIAAGSLVDGTSTTTFRDFLISPVTWIRARLPSSSITLLEIPDHPNDGEDWISGPDFPIEPDSLEGNEVYTDAGSAQSDQTMAKPGSVERVEWFAKRPFGKSAASSPLLLLACSPPREKTRLAAFKRELRKIVGGTLGAERIKELLQNSRSRRLLRDCYSQLAGDHNVLSVHLLVKPRGTIEISGPYSRHRSPSYHANDDRCSFLFSGDAKLSTAIYFNHWARFFGPYLSSVAYFSIPHHGAARSFNTALISALPNSDFIGQAGKNSYGHPAKSIERLVEGAHRSFWHVSEEAESRLDWKFKILV